MGEIYLPPTAVSQTHQYDNVADVLRARNSELANFLLDNPEGTKIVMLMLNALKNYCVRNRCRMSDLEIEARTNGDHTIIRHERKA